MKVRRKQKSRYKTGEYPKKGTPEYEKLTPQERKLANLARPFKPGETGNPLGRPVGSGSIVVHLRKAMKEPAVSKKYENTAAELSAVITKKARKGNLGFMQMIVDKTESKQMTREDVNLIIDQVYNVFLRHVKDEKTRSKISASMLGLHLGEE
jgi:hypothetical protein